MITVHVPAMTGRRDVRAISACISDVPGVQTLQADLANRTVRVTGSADPAAVTAAVSAAGYEDILISTDITGAAPRVGTAGSGPRGAPIQPDPPRRSPGWRTWRFPR